MALVPANKYEQVGIQGNHLLFLCMLVNEAGGKVIFTHEELAEFEAYHKNRQDSLAIRIEEDGYHVYIDENDYGLRRGVEYTYIPDEKGKINGN